jgi:cold-inducible RNA-binding protein
MNTKVYVDNLAAATTENDLIDLFSPYGNVVSVSIGLDRTSHKPRGFGFVTMVTPEGARAAIQALNDKAAPAGDPKAREARPDEEHPSSTNGRRSPRRRASHLF